MGTVSKLQSICVRDRIACGLLQIDASGGEAMADLRAASDALWGFVEQPNLGEWDISTRENDAFMELLDRADANDVPASLPPALCRALVLLYEATNAHLYGASPIAASCRHAGSARRWRRWERASRT